MTQILSRAAAALRAMRAAVTLIRETSTIALGLIEALTREALAQREVVRREKEVAKRDKQMEKLRSQNADLRRRLEAAVEMNGQMAAEILTLRKRDDRGRRLLREYAPHTDWWRE